MGKFDFSGWATRANLKCSDGRVIMKDAFKHNDGKTVPLVWNHRHDDPNEVLGHALLENREEGVYAYCKFNDTESGKTAKLLVQHGDVNALSIYANKLKQNMSNVIHGDIREVSLVLAGANPGAYIDSVIKHGEESDEEAVIFTGEELALYHAESDEETTEETAEEIVEETTEETIEHSDEETSGDSVPDIYNTYNAEQKELAQALIGLALTDGDDDGDDDDDDDIDEEVEHSAINGKTAQAIFDSFNEKQKNVLYMMIAEARKSATTNTEEINHSEGGNDSMKTNVFDKSTETTNGAVLSHADQQAILAMASETGCGSLQKAIQTYVAQNKDTMAHAFAEGADGVEALFPEHQLITPGAPKILRDMEQNWVMGVINKIKKSPYSRIRTRYADARVSQLKEELKNSYKAKGYNDREIEKKITGVIKLLGRKTEPTTVYIKDELHRDDIIDIEDFDVVQYIWNFMKDNYYETIALAALVGDDREVGDPDKISEENIRPIWKDDELYTRHADIDFAKAKAEIQGTNTAANFSENYIYSEAMIMTSLYTREKFKGTGTPDLYCAPHFVNVMLLARDLNGRRIYDSKADLARALNVNSIVEIEQLEGRTREDENGNTKKLIGLLVNLADYQFGAAKGGELTKFSDFDIDYNKNKYLMEGRLSGALTIPGSAIAIEELVETAAG